MTAGPQPQSLSKALYLGLVGRQYWLRLQRQAAKGHCAFSFLQSQPTPRRSSAQVPSPRACPESSSPQARGGGMSRKEPTLRAGVQTPTSLCRSLIPQAGCRGPGMGQAAGLRSAYVHLLVRGCWEVGRKPPRKRWPHDRAPGPAAHLRCQLSLSGGPLAPLDRKNPQDRLGV